jgi:isopentenyl phosphate kinase
MSGQISDQDIGHLQFLKLGGSLITDKTKPHSVRFEVLQRIAGELSNAYQEDPSIKLLLGHGSGSFGHVPAKVHGTRNGVSTAAQWRGFLEVWREAAALNRIVVDVLNEAGLPVITFPPSSCISARDGQVFKWNLAPLQDALEAGLLPVVYGDVVFDQNRGATILSTEDIFGYLAPHLRPERVLLAGLEEGVWEDYPSCLEIIPEITPDNLSAIRMALGGSASTDVTGGMYSKVLQSIEIAQENTSLEVLIFSGEKHGAVGKVLLGAQMGTVIRSR